jgi:hypothetical protein
MITNGTEGGHSVFHSQKPQNQADPSQIRVRVWHGCVQVIYDEEMVIAFSARKNDSVR